MATRKINKDLLNEASKHERIDLGKLWSTKLRFTPEELKKMGGEDEELDPKVVNRFQ